MVALADDDSDGMIADSLITSAAAALGSEAGDNSSAVASEPPLHRQRHSYGGSRSNAAIISGSSGIRVASASDAPAVQIAAFLRPRRVSTSAARASLLGLSCLDSANRASASGAPLLPLPASAAASSSVGSMSSVTRRMSGMRMRQKPSRQHLSSSTAFSASPSGSVDDSDSTAAGASKVISDVSIKDDTVDGDRIAESSSEMSINANATGPNKRPRRSSTKGIASAAAVPAGTRTGTTVGMHKRG